MVLSAPVFERPADRTAELSGQPGIVRFLDVPPHRFVMIDGEGPPGTDTFAPRMPGLYATAYKLRFALKGRGVLTRVGPLEGLWWTAEEYVSAVLDEERDLWHWTLLIALPDEATPAEIGAALDAGREKLDPTLAPTLRAQSIHEGRSVQILHVGPYATERASIDCLHRSAADAGLRLRDRHHELYLGNPRTSAPARLRTLLRQPVV